MRRFWIGLLVVALALAGIGAGLVFGLDGRWRAEAERQVSAQLRDAVPFTVQPTVGIEGYPFLWHAATRRFPAVRVQGAEMPLALGGGTTLPFYEVDATLRDVSFDEAQVRGASLAGTGRLAYDDVGRLADARVTHAGGDRVAFERRLSVQGLNLEVRLTGVPAWNAERQTLSIAQGQLDVAGVRLPDQATDALMDRMVQPIAAPLPLGLRLDAVRPTPEGLWADVSGADVVFPLR